jgi:hypothetical protein
MKAQPILMIGHVSENNTIRLESYQEATNAWLVLASMNIPAALNAGADGWYPNTETTAWGQETGLDYGRIPDLKITETDSGFRIESQSMMCEIPASAKKLWSKVHGIITEYMDRVDSGCWEVA